MNNNLQIYGSSLKIDCLDKIFFPVLVVISSELSRGLIGVFDRRL